MKKTTRAAPSLIETLEQLKAYTEFESVTVGKDGSVSVKYAGKQPTIATKKPQREPEVKKTAIDSLALTPPPFEFGN